MRSRWTRHLWWCLTFLMTSTGLASEPSSRFVLGNGLRVVVSPSPNPVPVTCVHLGYDLSALAGSESPYPQKARLLRVLLEPTPWVGVGLGRRWVEESGGQLSFGTDGDVISLSTEIPSVQLAMVLWREAERMRSLVVGALPTAEVGEWAPWIQVERRARAHLYGEVSRGRRGTSVITAEELGEQVRRYFTPNNAALALTGGVTMRQVRSLVEKYFGDIPRGSPPPPQTTELPPARGPRRLSLEDNTLSEGVVWVSWVVPPLEGEHKLAFEVMATVLFDGDGSRLRQRLVRTGQVPWFEASWEQGRGLGQLWFLMARGQGDPVEDLTAELAELATTGPSELELARARQILAARVYEIQSEPQQLARQLVVSALQSNDPASELRDPGRWSTVDAPMVAAAVRAFLAPSSRNVVDVGPVPARGEP